jgi:RNA-directed DNA polymerase
MSHAWLMRFLEHRIGDRRMLRLIGKWLKAGVLEEGRLLTVERGTPQGAVISPFLANIYLHYVYDLWVQRWRRRSAQGDVIVVRYADDMVVGFQYLADAHRFLAELKQRLEAFALEVHPDKTRIIEFGRFACENRRARGQGKPETFAFLGFTHIYGRSREGRGLIRRHTVRERLNAKLRQVKATLRRMRHMPIPEQGRYLRLVLNGFYNYYAVPTNFRALNSFYWHILRSWQHGLRRRSQRHRLTCQRMMRLAARWLPSPKLRHPCPDWRFDVMTRGRSPVR